MNSAAKKFEIRRRLYQSKRRAGKPIDDSLAAFFEDCSMCCGRGQICTEWNDDGVQVAALETCTLCSEDGFIFKQN